MRLVVAVVAVVAAASAPVAGCGAPTRVVADITTAPFLPTSLALNIAGGQAPATKPLVADGQPLALPARVTIELPDEALPLMLGVHAMGADGRAADGAAAVTSAPHRTVDVPLSLALTTGCSGLGVAVCEDFESSAYDATTWIAGTANGGTATVDGAHTHDGRFALHLHTPAGSGGGAGISEMRFSPRDASDLFVRLWVYAPTLVADGRLTSISQADAPFGGIDLYLEGTSIGIENKVSNTFHGGAGTPLQAGRWTCIEQELATSSPNTTRAWIDGALVIDAGDATVTTPPPASVDVGLAFYDAQSRAAIDLWIDDVAVDRARIGCAP
ncbi:MAG: hypothetical protein LC659_12610 [Myxococcales bacterium]|nr:hypothetical protein [Myxococcales bacterium]